MVNIFRTHILSIKYRALKKKFLKLNRDHAIKCLKIKNSNEENDRLKANNKCSIMEVEQLKINEDV